MAPSKRLISFSLFGNDPKYLDGARPNVELARAVYPGWTCRFYVSEEAPAELAKVLMEEGAEVVLKRRYHQWDGLFWRFLAAEDPKAELAIFRDVDSRLNWRERHAVDAWLTSGRSAHIMRDHPLHNGEILAGLWGCRRGILSGIESMIARWNQFDHPGSDQLFLAAMVYPRIRADALIHSDLFAFEGESPVPFPTSRKDYEWVGAPVIAPGVAPLPIPETFRPMVDARQMIVRRWNPDRLAYWKLRSRIPFRLRKFCDTAWGGKRP